METTTNFYRAQSGDFCDGAKMRVTILLRRSFACAVTTACLLMAHSVPGVVEAQSDVGSDGAARAHFEEARAAYDAQHFDDAARSFRRAYLLSPRFELLYNIGQSELRAGHDGLALEAFEAFLRQAPEGNANRSEVAERARVLQSMGVVATVRREEPPAPAAAPATEVSVALPVAVEPPIPPSVPAPAPTLRHDVLVEVPAATADPLARTDSARVASDGPGGTPWIVLASGGAVLVAGGVLMGVGASSATSITGAVDGARWADLEGTANDAKLMWGVGMALAGVGLAATALGLVWALSDSTAGHADEATARLRVSPLGLALEGEF